MEAMGALDSKHKAPHPDSRADDHPTTRKPRVLGTPEENARLVDGFGMTSVWLFGMTRVGFPDDTPRSALLAFALCDARLHQLLDQRNRHGLIERKVDGAFGGRVGLQFVFELFNDRGGGEQTAMA